ncbi:hypothetical protein FKM82_028654 [Ascaphus truei]
MVSKLLGSFCQYRLGGLSASPSIHAKFCSEFWELLEFRFVSIMLRSRTSWPVPNVQSFLGLIWLDPGPFYSVEITTGLVELCG